MSTGWYYVQGSERVGPVDQSDIENLFHEGVLNPESYVWRKGFDNWKNLNAVDEFGSLLMGGASSSDSQSEFDEDTGSDLSFDTQEESQEDIQMGSSSDSDEDDVSFIPKMGDSSSGPFDINSIGAHSKVFSIKVGLDRGGSESEFGPFSLEQLKRAYQENRINEKTFIFTPGMETWVFLGDFPRFNEIAGGLPPEISEADRRFNIRKPFVARLFFHDNKQVYEGICRNISVGGLQVLVSDFPCEVGEKVSMNVHPDNTDYHFTASGKVVRKLEGDTGFSLRFEDLSQDAHSAIQSYINEN